MAFLLCSNKTNQIDKNKYFTRYLRTGKFILTGSRMQVTSETGDNYNADASATDGNDSCTPL